MTLQGELSGKVALVTGGGRDIGRAVCLAFAKAGAAVAVNYNASADKANDVVREIEELGGRAVAVKGDVTRAQDVEATVAAASSLGSSIDILVNNAGGLIARKKLDEMDETFWDDVMAINLKSVFLVTKAVVPRMTNGGSIVNLSSRAARDGGGGGALAYSAAKGAVLTLTRGLSKELASKKIRVNCVSPGMIDTTFHDTFTSPEVRRTVASRTSVGREGTSDDVANAILFLASDRSAYITGESIEINGGIYFV
jgi:3-oxoacyl-[acyl-carrier protein] reductase